MTRIISQDLFPDHRPVGRPRTSTKTRAEQLRINQKNYRARQKLKHKNIDNPLSKQESTSQNFRARENAKGTQNA